MEKLTRKESLAIVTIHDALRELRIKGRQAKVEMYSNQITISDYADTVNEVKELRNLFSFFKDDDDTIKVRKIEESEGVPEFWVVRLIKRMV